VSNDIQPHGRLPVDEAFRILVRDLETRGNVLSDWHRAALLELLDAFAEYIEGKAWGRKAFGLPTGMGKTSAVAAFIAALYKLDPIGNTAIAVAASKVEALCELKRELIRLEVAPEQIGLKHVYAYSKHARPERATEHSTGDDSRRFQLVTHARLRSGKDIDLFTRFQARPRAVLIYDETLFRSDVLTLTAMDLGAAVGALGGILKYGDGSPMVHEAHKYIAQCTELVSSAVRELTKRGDPDGVGMQVDLPDRKPAEIRAYRATVESVRGLSKAQSKALDDLLQISQETLRVLVTEEGKGIVWTKPAIPKEARNIVVLDASQTIRELVKLDTSIAPVNSFDTDLLKTYEGVQVVQIMAHGGRASMERASKRERDQKAATLSLEVIDLVRQHWETARGILIFAYKEKKGTNIVGTLRRDLKREGFGIDEERGGKPRLQFLTWGDETALNGYEHCDVVIMAGVLHRDKLELSGAMRGQMPDDGREKRTPRKAVVKISESEIAHLIYQGASRGACRRINNGHAAPMQLYFIHAHAGIKGTLDVVMPGAIWSTRAPKYLTPSKRVGATETMAGRIQSYLDAVDKVAPKVRTAQIKTALRLDTGNAGARKAFDRAVQSIDGWDRLGQSLVRTHPCSSSRLSVEASRRCTSS